MTGPFAPGPDITDPEKRRKADLKARYLNWIVGRNTDWDAVQQAWLNAAFAGGTLKYHYDPGAAKMTVEHILPEEPKA